MFIGFANFNKHFEQCNTSNACLLGLPIWTNALNSTKRIPENIVSGKRIYSGKFICSSTCHDAILDDTWVSKILIYMR
jgi:hypothetical protein